MGTDAESIKRLRERTAAGVMECKKALSEAHGDIDRAVEILKERGLSKVAKRAERVASQGVIEAYIHAGGRIGTLVEVNTETDFVARTDEFKTLAHDIAMQVAATAPRYVSCDEVPADAEENPCEVCLLEQPFIKNPSLTVKDRINEVIAKTGENVVVRRFARFELGGQ